MHGFFPPLVYRSLRQVRPGRDQCCIRADHLQGRPLCELADGMGHFSMHVHVCRHPCIDRLRIRWGCFAGEWHFCLAGPLLQRGPDLVCLFFLRSRCHFLAAACVCQLESKFHSSLPGPYDANMRCMQHECHNRIRCNAFPPAI